MDETAALSRIEPAKPDERRISSKNDDIEMNYDVKDTAGVKVIHFDEDVQKVFCARNTSPFGYIAVVGQNMVILYLTYAEEASAAYDHIWKLS